MRHLKETTMQTLIVTSIVLLSIGALVLLKRQMDKFQKAEKDTFYHILVKRFR